MRVGTAFLDVHRRLAFEFAVTAIVIGGGEHHGLIGTEFGESAVAPMRGKLRRQFGVVFLETDIGATVFELSYYHLRSSLVWPSPKPSPKGEDRMSKHIGNC